MSSPRLPLSARPSFLPDEISRREFATVFRGYDPAEVRTFLNQLSEQAAELSDRVAELQQALADSERMVENPDLDEETVTKLLGAQTAQVLRSAREAANEMRQKAEEDVSRQLREAHEVTTRMREEAEAILSERTEEAERAASTIKSSTEENVAKLKADSEETAQRLRTETEAEMMQLRQNTQSDLVDERARARQQMRDIIDTARAEAQELVERTQERQNELLENVVRKRKIAVAQVEELRAGRTRLLDAYKVVRETLDGVTVELGRAESEAREQASEAGLRAAENADLEPSDLSEEINIEQFSLSDDVSQKVIDLSSEGPGTHSGGSVSQGSSQIPSSSDGGSVDTLEREQTQQTTSLFDDAEDDASEDVEELLEVHRSAVDDETELDEALQLRREAVVHKAAAQTIRRLERVLTDEQDALLYRLTSATDDDDVASIIGSIDDQTANYQRSIVRLFREIVRTGASSVSETVDRGSTDHAGTAAARGLAGELVEDVRANLVPIVEGALSAPNIDTERVRQDLQGPYDSVLGDHLAQMVEDRALGAFDQGVAFARES